MATNRNKFTRLPATGSVPDNAPAFKIVASTNTKKMLYAGFGCLQTALTLYVCAILSSAAIFTQNMPNPKDPEQWYYHRDCLLYMSFVDGTAPLGACIWPAVIAGICAAAAVIMSAYDVYVIHRVYPSRSRTNVFVNSIIAAVSAFLMVLIGVQIAVGLSSACKNVTSQNEGLNCRDAFDLLNTNRDLVATGSAVSFMSAGLWGYYAYTEFHNFRNL
ncbi:hypothetical protein BC829DRAFT_382856 [Chytridium lagenaria]|nr:hypothetical protein BC829DRAFT_382856 [Chytridium lagenaria]